VKKVIYISAVILGLGFVSCQKQEITPAQELDAPVWHEAPDSEENARSSNSNNNSDARVGGDDQGMPTDNGDGTVFDGGITDPNTDPDEDGPQTGDSDED
jgi:hypothetical protein